jgi:DNA-binding Lrp family transcriptional regulator
VKKIFLLLLLLFFSYAASVGIAENAMYAYVGNKSAVLASLKYPPYKTIVLVNGEYKETVKERVAGLAEYGITIKELSPALASSTKDSLIIICSAAMPREFLTNNETFSNNRVVYFGKMNLVLDSDGMKEENWSENFTKPIAVLDGVDTLLGKDEQYFLFGVYEVEGMKEGTGTIYVSAKEAKNGRLLIGKEITDGYFKPLPVYIDGKNEIYLWESTELSFSVPRADGALFFSLEKDGKKMYEKKLGFVTSPKAFVERLSFNESGVYVAKVYDRLNLLGAVLLNVKGVDVEYVGKKDVNQIFNITVNSEPVKSGFAYVSVGGGVERRLPVVDGILVVPAKLKKGDNIFRIKYLNFEKEINIQSEVSSVWDVYITYGIPGLLLIVAAFAYGRIAKKPTYRIITHEAAEELLGRKRVTAEDIKEVFGYVERHFGWKNVPLTIRDVSWGIKETIAEGMDVSEGNVEEILKKLEKKGVVEGYAGYYQLKGAGDIKTNVLKRMIRDMLVEKGIEFKEEGDVFKTEEWRIGPPRAKIGKNEIIVVLDEKEKREFMRSLGDLEPKIRLKMGNGVVRVVSFDELREIL